MNDTPTPMSMLTVLVNEWHTDPDDNDNCLGKLMAHWPKWQG